MRHLCAAVTGLVVASVLSTAAFADEGAIKYRQASMKAVGGHMGAIAGILKGEVPHKDQLLGHTQALHALALNTHTLFPEGSGKSAGKTEALDKVWSDPDGFKKVVMSFESTTKTLVMAAESGDMGAVGEALGAVGKDGCKACHTDYREKK